MARSDANNAIRALVNAIGSAEMVGLNKPNGAGRDERTLALHEVFQRAVVGRAKAMIEREGARLSTSREGLKKLRLMTRNIEKYEQDADKATWTAKQTAPFLDHIWTIFKRSLNDLLAVLNDL